MSTEDSKNVKALRTALAISRGIEIMDGQLSDIVENTEGRNAPNRFEFLSNFYLNLHQKLYQDWGHTAGVGGIKSGEDRLRLRDMFISLSTDSAAGKSGSKTVPPMLDSNGYFISYKPEEFAKVLADFSIKMLEFKPFANGNEMTLNFFLTALSQVDDFHEVYPAGIDFRRLDEKDRIALHDYNRPDANIPKKAVETALMHAMDASRTPSVFNRPEPGKQFDYIPRNEKRVGGIRFLSHTDEDGTKYLVTVKGTMVPLNVVQPSLADESHPEGKTLAAYLQEQIATSGKNLADYISIPNEALLKGSDGKPVCLPGTERLQDKAVIDNVRVDGTSTPLLCLDINIITGLRGPSQTDLENLITDVEEKGTPIFRLHQNEGLVKRLHDKVDQRYPREADRKTAERLHRSVDIAYERVSLMTPYMDGHRNAILEGKENPLPEGQNPVFMMSMGGAGSGKSQVRDTLARRIKALHGDSISPEAVEKTFVEASLDEFRKKSDLYSVVTAAQHHADDYGFVDPFAKALRDWVAGEAQNRGLNVLYDGSGVPYKGRYDAIVKQFKAKNYHTEVVAVDADIMEALDRVKKRGEETGRYMPWKLVVKKHLQAPAGVIDAAHDANLDALSLYANDGALGTPPRLIAEIVDNTALKPHDDNAYTLPLNNGRTRGLQIHDIDRFNQFMKKGRLNIAASSREGLWTPPTKAAFLYDASAASIGKNQQPSLFAS